MEGAREGREAMRNVRLQKATERKDEEPVMSPTLPDELVEDIVAMMPFPSIFKSRCLSKSWLVRLSSISSLDDEEEKQLASAFQKNVAKRSSNWATFCPIFVTGECIRGYNQASGKWQTLTLPPLPFPNHSWSSFSSERFLGPEMEGALLTLDSHHPQCMKDLRVGNMLTAEWKQLPPSPDACQRPDPFRIIQLVGNTELGTYKVIIVCQTLNFTGGRTRLSLDSFIHVYDSRSESWRTKTIDTALHLSGSYVYHSGVLYILSWDRFYPPSWRNLNNQVVHHAHSLLTINEGGDWQSKEIELWSEREVDGLDPRLVVCNDDLFLIYVELDCTVIVLRIDPESSKVEEVARCATSSFRLDTFENTFNIPVSEVTSIFYAEHSYYCPCMRERIRQQVRTESATCGLLLTYNQNRDEWNFFSFPKLPQHLWTNMSFQPGLNPFMTL